MCFARIIYGSQGEKLRKQHIALFQDDFCYVVTIVALVSMFSIGSLQSLKIDFRPKCDLQWRLTLLFTLRISIYRGSSTLLTHGARLAEHVGRIHRTKGLVSSSQSTVRTHYIVKNNSKRCEKYC